MKRSVMFALVLVAVLAAECRSASYSFKQLDLQDGSAGFGINNSGQVVGVSAPMGPPVLYSGGMKHTLVTEGSGLDINENGQIVGTAYNGDFSDNHAFVWPNSNSAGIDLNTVIPPNSGWILNVARSINNRGEISAAGELNGTQHACLLVPVPSR